MTMKNKVLTAGSLACVPRLHQHRIHASRHRAGRRQRQGRDPRSTGRAPPPTKAPPVADFRRQFVEVAKTIRPAVVTVTSTSTVEVGGRGSPFEGSPFEFFFRGLPRPKASSTARAWAAA